MVNTQATGGDRNRDRLRYLIARNWRRAGRIGWTDAELEAATDAAVSLRATPMPSVDPPPAESRPPVQLPLFGANATTRRTRAIAAASSLPSGPSRRELVARYVASCRHAGATREAIAEALELPIQTVCPLVKSMEQSGRLVPTSRTRPTRSGKPAAIVVVPEFADGAGEGNR